MTEMSFDRAGPMKSRVSLLSAMVEDWMSKFVLSALSLGLVLAAQPAAAQMAPAEGKEVTLTAAVVDLSCKVVFNAQGEDHRMCAQVCFDLGIPLGLMTDDGTLYLPVTMAMGQERGDKDLRGHAEHNVTVKGKVIERGGMHTILINDVKMEG
jgi:hypothetical protein